MKQEFVTLPRAVVEHVMHHLNRGDDDAVCWADGVIKPALEQSQRKLTAQDIADSALLGNIESPFNACMHQGHCRRWKAQANHAVQHLDMVPLPREVVEQALEALINEGEFRKLMKPLIEKSIDSIRAALDHPQNHVPDAGNMVPAGWRLVPVEPTRGMLDAAHKDLVRDAEIDMMLKGIHSAMLDAAPQPPAVEQPRGEQEPVAWQYRMRPDWGIKKDCWGPWQDCTREQAAMYQRVPLLHEWVYESRQLYTHPQPKRDPLTDEQIDAIADAMPGGLEGFLKGWGWRQFARAVLEATNNIK